MASVCSATSSTGESRKVMGLRFFFGGPGGFVLARTAGVGCFVAMYYEMVYYAAFDRKVFA